MRYKVTGKQPNSKMCLVCGLKNPYGLKTFFYELENGELMSVCRLMEEHQSYPNRLHGGITTALLDETIGRAILIKSKGEIWGVTLEFTTRYKKPIPLDGELRVIERITVPIFYQSWIDILPHLDTSKTMMEQYNVVTIAMHLVIYLEPINISKGHVYSFILSFLLLSGSYSFSKGHSPLSFSTSR